ncbi:hypothetical protein BDW59DRAFT_165780 [Aspergillus cavernicola]|uniref:Uncharacterized protein n=1 Tax=Aspergillus cavernicola TaxID=176166 RepID=A0ABR4HQI3_9EURO
MSAIKEENSLHVEDVQSQDMEKNDQPIPVTATEEAFIRKKVCYHIVCDGPTAARGLPSSTVASCLSFASSTCYLTWIEEISAM